MNFSKNKWKPLLTDVSGGLLEITKSVKKNKGPLSTFKVPESSGTRIHITNWILRMTTKSNSRNYNLLVIMEFVPMVGSSNPALHNVVKWSAPTKLLVNSKIFWHKIFRILCEKLTNVWWQTLNYNIYSLRRIHFSSMKCGGHSGMLNWTYMLV